ncbi:MAG: hypothetical protein H7Y38_06455 [Armatimonadetes bacterium]|nr:hypothetical protein [Armatimonadota bacterium]
MSDLFSPEGFVHQSLLTAHIAAGSVALFAAPVALAVAKGSVAHRRAGWVYTGAMGFVAVSALVMAIMKPKPFLLLLAVFAFYLSLTGVRMLRLKYRDAAKRAPELLDHAVAGVMAASAVGLLALSAWGLWRGEQFAVVYGVFGAISLFLVAGEGRARQLAETDRKKWLSLHIQRMMAAYISTVTAFAAVNFGRWFPGISLIVTWLLPTAIGVPVIFFLIHRFVRAKKPGVIHVAE